MNYFIVALLSAVMVGALPDGFVYINDVDPSIRVNLKYFGTDNFIGWKIFGYNANKGILTKEAAIALSKAQKIFNSKGYCILVYDAYRPQCAVDSFVNWIENSSDNRNKEYYYPRVDKKDLIKKGYVASRSGHSRGSTLDMTVIRCDYKHLEKAIPEKRDFNGTILTYMNDRSIDTGTGFDLMDEASHVKNSIVLEYHDKARKYINDVMASVDFKVLAEEWWHFTLVNEPFKDKYFNFTID